MPLYDCMLLFKPHLQKKPIMNLVARVGKHIYRRNGVLTDIKSFGTVQLGYGIKKLDGRYYQVSFDSPWCCYDFVYIFLLSFMSLYLDNVYCSIVGTACLQWSSILILENLRMQLLFHFVLYDLKTIAVRYNIIQLNYFLRLMKWFPNL